MIQFDVKSYIVKPVAEHVISNSKKPVPKCQMKQKIQNPRNLKSDGANQNKSNNNWAFEIKAYCKNEKSNVAKP